MSGNSGVRSLILDFLGFSRFQLIRVHDLTPIRIIEKVDPNWDGVYKIRILRKKRGSEPIQGIKGPGQIIYIGSSLGKSPSSGIRFRLRRHLKSIIHTNDCMCKVRKLYHLEFSVKVTKRKDARDYEKIEKEAYLKTFGEYPLCTGR